MSVTAQEAFQPEQLAGPTGLTSHRPRLLLLSYHFPPGQSPGALRWEMLAAHADRRGYGLDVLTVHPASLPESDMSRLRNLPPDTRVLGVPLPTLVVERLEHFAWRALRQLRGARPAAPSALAPTPAAAAGPAAAAPGSYGRDEIPWSWTSAGCWKRAYYAWLEAQKDLAWALCATSAAGAWLAEHNHQAIICCGPPHMPHEAARRLAATTGLPLVLDLRDPWRLQQRLPATIASPLWFRLAARYEQQAVAAASLIVANTEPSRDGMRALYPAQAERIIAVMNGYDEDPLPPSRRGDRFVAAYAGSIYLDRDPRPLFRAAARVIATHRLTPAQFGLAFIGNVDSYGGVPLSRMAVEEGIGGYVETGPSRPRGAAMEFLAGATMLVSLPQDSDMAIPSKIFEYVRFHAWLLALVSRSSATGRALDGTDADVVEPADEAGITAALERRWLAFAAGERPGRLRGSEPLSRGRQAAILFDALALRLTPVPVLQPVS
ncbi:MAG: glycosyltransferase [Gemmatimonadota bacterium]|nr:glycosyltransferase [Gemmatimonadota bacterium]